MRRHIALILIGIFAVNFFVKAAAQSDLSQQTTRQPLGQQAYIAPLPVAVRDAWFLSPEDTFKALIAEFPTDISLENLPQSDVAGLQWHANSTDKLLLNAPSRFSWVVVDVTYRGSSAAPFLLDMTGIDGVGWYYINHLGEADTHWDNFDLPQGGRPVFDTKAVLPLNLVPGHRYRIHLAALTVTDGKYASFNVWSADRFREQRLRQTLIDGAYFGLAIALFVYNLWLFAALRRITHLYFCLFVLSSAGMIYIGSGISLLFGLKNPFPLSLPLAYMFQGLIGISAAVFSMNLLNITNRHSLLYRMWIAVIGLNLITTPTIMFMARDGGFSPTSISMTFDILTWVWLISQVAYVYTLILHWRHSLLVRVWFTAVTVHTWAMGIWPTLLNSSIDMALAPYHLAQIATLLDTFVLSALIAYGIRDEQRSRIQAQKQAVESLRLSHDIEQAKSNFVATVGHDLRAPVQAISHFTESIRLTTPDVDRNILNKIDENIGKISGLINSMIRLSRSEWQARNPKLESVHLASVFSELKNEFLATCIKKDLKLQFEDNDCRILSDHISISQILRNLLDNAVKNTDKGYITLSATEQGSQVIIRLRDTGQGIHDEDLAHIFEPFYQAFAGNGVGLGLSIVKRLCDLLNITIEVASTPGYGTRFTLTMARSEDATLVNDNMITSLGHLDVRIVSPQGQLSTLTEYLIQWGANVTESGLTELAAAPQSNEITPLWIMEVPAYLSAYSLLEKRAEVFVFIVTQPGNQISDQRILTPRHIVIASDTSPMQLRSLIQRRVTAQP
jgi:signal transduction histidine kinase